MRRYLGPLALGLIVVSGSALAQAPLTATYGTPVELTVENDLAQLITFEGKAGETIYASEFSETVNIPMILYGPDGTQLATSVNFQMETITPVELPADGTYTVSVQRPDYDDTTGSTSVIIDTTELGDLGTEPVSGSFSYPGEMRWFAHQAKAGDLYRMAATCGDCSFFEILPTQDIVGVTYTQQNPLWILDQWKDDGRVLFGSYTTTASEYSFSLLPVTATPITQGTPTEGNVANGGFETFTFNSAEGKAWRIDATMSNQGDRIMRLFQFQDRPSWDTVVGTDSGSGPEGNPQITPFIAPADAPYFVVIEWRGYREEMTESPYTVSLRPESLRQLTTDGVGYDGALTGTAGTERYLYRGTTGETLTLTLTRTGGEGQPFIRIVGPDDEAMTFFGRAATRLVVDLMLPSDGLYQVAVNNISYDNTSTLNYTISLQPTTAP